MACFRRRSSAVLRGQPDSGQWAPIMPTPVSAFEPVPNTESMIARPATAPIPVSAAGVVRSAVLDLGGGFPSLSLPRTTLPSGLGRRAVSAPMPDTCPGRARRRSQMPAPESASLGASSETPRPPSLFAPCRLRFDARSANRDRARPSRRREICRRSRWRISAIASSRTYDELQIDSVLDDRHARRASSRWIAWVSCWSVYWACSRPPWAGATSRSSAAGPRRARRATRASPNS